MRFSAPFNLPRPEDVAPSDQLRPAQWAEVTAVATVELARRTRPALVSYLLLIALAAWGSDALDRTSPGERWTLVIVSAGLVLAGGMRHIVLQRPLATLRWWRRFGVLTVVQATLVGGLGAAMTLQLGLGTAAVVYWLVLAGTAAGATSGLTPSPLLGRIYVWTTLAPLVLAAAYVSHGRNYAIPCIVLVYLVFMVTQAARSSRGYWAGIISQVVLREQTAELEAARQEAQTAFEAQAALLDELRAHGAEAERDYGVAARIFASILDRSCFKLGSIRAVVSPLQRFNGDLVMAANAPGGRIRVFLGDFTGHGLSAAVGALPVAELFFSAAAQGAPLETLLRDMNRTVRNILPPGFFLAAFLAELEPGAGRMTSWNGGMPEPFIVDGGGPISARLPSTHLPLGVLANTAFRPTLRTVGFGAGQRLLAYSDGVVETASPQGELFGAARLEQSLSNHTGPGFLLDDVRRSIEAYREGSRTHDDVTLLELSNDDLLIAELKALGSTTGENWLG